MTLGLGLGETYPSSFLAGVAAMRFRGATATDLILVAGLISQAHRDVALAFGLTAENCPRHPSFCTPAWVERGMACGETYFILERDSVAVGCVACRLAETGVAALNRLSVLESERRRGHGGLLVAHCLDHAKAAGARSVRIGVIERHVALRDWYRQRGFEEGPIERFPHLPFAVQSMFHRLGATVVIGEKGGPAQEPPFVVRRP
ncbi:GNAT family N-acetyltransferase [Rhodospirillum rubrum]|uniref:GNAT family N-acetyltransferase n=1 Tax=Rhodospirillum rubrum TaxID=1085 RepID=UPI00003C2ADC|nr:GNAT family N-acetyltransferase [Rhodospirillum rubrum]AEO46615.1 GCN5-related N-acetyltransferase [Rhodospirillum rubrum F11]